ncbi:MAG: hypothetical protein U9R19_04115 [Bacteroidota bacterium]|nr:hypothetical protein [Bacteroidota bacterium]
MKVPKAFYKNTKNIKAFVLGCDPTAKDKNGKRLEFEYVFDLGNDKRYFAGILKNLELIGLSLDDIYVQNLITDYQSEETTLNMQWNRTALENTPDRKKEFDEIDPSGTIPVFLTSEILYKVLLKSNHPKHTAKDLYEKANMVPIPALANELGRYLIPLYRHFKYSLKEKEEYKNHVKSILSK